MKSYPKSLVRLLGNNPAMIEKYLQLFKTNAPGELSNLNVLIQKKKWQEAGVVAHALKSQLQYLDLEAAVRLAQQLESLCGQDTPDERRIRQLVTQLMRVVQTQIQQL
ncbi:Hpt domain-containing protein [Lewinella sp. LCG006]|uniref:Hpt domain-containing protein n=1 Tax=Lewinella sp. LCG006 TaxID=3231911 RepID=UPI0034610A41